MLAVLHLRQTLQFKSRVDRSPKGSQQSADACWRHVRAGAAGGGDAAVLLAPGLPGHPGCEEGL